MSNTMDDRREHPRYAARLDLQGAAGEGGSIARMVSTNLSMGGVYCTSSQDYPEMTRLAVRLMLPPSDQPSAEPDPVEVEAVVVRRREVPSSLGPGRFELALFFTKVEVEVRRRLAVYLQHQQQHAERV